MPLLTLPARHSRAVFLSKLAIALISPLGLSLVLGVIALLLAGFGRKRLASLLGGTALFWLWLWSLPVASMWLRGYIEQPFPETTVESLPQADAIVVLGGAIQPPSIDEMYPNLGAAADRVWHAARLYHADKAPLLVLSGGSDSSLRSVSEAQAMQWLLSDLGIPCDAMVLEDRSRNTQQNARLTASLLRERNLDSILLVTSALHMRRALPFLRGEGLQVNAAATDHEARSMPGWQRWLPDAGALEGSARALKEWVGFHVSRYRD